MSRRRNNERGVRWDAGRNRWIAVLDLPPIDGKRRQEYHAFTNAADANTWIRGRRAEIDGGDAAV